MAVQLFWKVTPSEGHPSTSSDSNRPLQAGAQDSSRPSRLGCVRDLHTPRKLGRALLQRLQCRTHLVRCLLLTLSYFILSSLLGPSTGEKGGREGGKRTDSQSGWLSSRDTDTPSRSSPTLKMSCASPYLFPPMPTNSQ